MEKKQLQRLVFSALMLLYTTQIVATELGDSIDTFQNQTVSTDVLVQGRSVLTVNNVTVTATGSLTANAPEGIVINNPFEVNTGGTLELTIGQPYRIQYTYDAAGNRKSRRKVNQ